MVSEKLKLNTFLTSVIYIIQLEPMYGVQILCSALQVSVGRCAGDTRATNVNGERKISDREQSRRRMRCGKLW